jgi:hypothetical protein
MVADPIGVGRPVSKTATVDRIAVKRWLPKTLAVGHRVAERPIVKIVAMCVGGRFS